MTHALLPLLTIGYIVLLVAYFVSFHGLFKVIEAEKPEWLHYKGEPSIFYTGMPRSVDPNIGVKVLAVAFSRKAGELQDASAYEHAKTIRFVLPAGLLAFAGMLYLMLARGAA